MSCIQKELTGVQIAIVHIAKNKIGMTEDEYRALLSNYGVEHSNELSYNQFLDIMAVFKKSGFNKEKSGLSEYERVKLGLATEKQIAMIKGMWMEKSRIKTIRSLESFINRIVGKISLNILTYKDARKVIMAIKNLTTNHNLQCTMHNGRSCEELHSRDDLLT